MTKTILVADDSKTIQRVVDLTFRATDFRVVSATTPDDARSAIAVAPPDIILADVAMGEADGYALCEELRHAEATARTPILLLGGAFEPVDEQRAQSAGASGHLTKPFDTQTLIDRVAELIGVPSVAPPPMSFVDRLAQRNSAAAEPAKSNGAAASQPPMAASQPPMAASEPPMAASEPPMAASEPPMAASEPPAVIDAAAGLEMAPDDGLALEPPLEVPDHPTEAAPPPDPSIGAAAIGGLAAAAGAVAGLFSGGDAEAAPDELAMEAPVEVSGDLAIEPPVDPSGDLAIDAPVEAADDFAMEAPVEAADDFAMEVPIELPMEAVVEDGADEIVPLAHVIEPLPLEAMSEAPGPMNPVGPESLPPDAFQSVPADQAALAQDGLRSFPPQPPVTQPPGFASEVPHSSESYDSVPVGFIVQPGAGVAVVDDGIDEAPAEAAPPPIDDLVAAPEFAAPVDESGLSDEIQMSAADLESAAPSLEAPPPPGSYAPEAANVDVWSLAEPGDAPAAAAPPPAADAAMAAPDAWNPPPDEPDDQWSESSAQPSWEVPVLPAEGQPAPEQWQQAEPAWSPPPEAAAPAVETAAPAVDSAAPAVAAAVGAVAAVAAAPVADAAAAVAPSIPREELVAMAREVIEQVAWEVVPELAETIIRRELSRLLAEDS